MSIPDNVLGIDASTNSLAFCHMKKGRPQSWGELNYVHDSNLFHRLASIEQRAGIIVDKYSDVDYVLIEAPVRVNNVRVLVALAYSYGIVAAKFAARKIEVADVAPVVWQRYIGNSTFSASDRKALKNKYPGKSASWYTNKVRSIRKARTMDWAHETFGISTESDNVSDAIGIAAYATRIKS